MIATGLQIQLIQLSRRTKRFIAIVSDTIVLLVALAVTIFLLNGQLLSSITERASLFLAVILVALPVFVQLRFYEAIIRFIGAQLVFGVLRAVSIVALALACAGLFFGPDPVASVFSMTLIFWAFALLGIVGSRFVMRAYLMRAHLVGERVAVYGAGEAGV
ncbi:MAG: hypothetical protein QGH93_06185, partial [Gammaproteobacteria bacterium]|nr:hypothetical protein [Gammaproteobacteria bacterium]